MQKRIVVVLDTNVFVSGLLSPQGIPATILSRFRRRDFKIATSREQIREIHSVLKRPALTRILPKGTLRDVLRFFLHFKKLTEFYHPQKMKWSFQDRGDHFLLDLSMAAQADFLVTGDKDLRSLKRVGTCKIVSPREFLTHL